MISVNLKNIRMSDGVLSHGGGTIKITVRGHSGYGSLGGDIVCAGISAVIQTGILGIIRVARVKQRLKKRKGYLESVIDVRKNDDEAMKGLLIILTTVVLGLEEINKAYPGSVEIIYS